MDDVEWGEYEFQQIFNRIEQGRRLKKEDQLSGNIPFVMAGITNTGVVNYVSNPIASFPQNSITVDIFGNTFYRDYAFGAGDDTGVYWNDKIEYSRGVMLFFAAAMQKALTGKFSYGKKLRSSQSLNFKMLLPTKDGKIDFDFMESFIAELEAERVAELEAERVAELSAYLTVSGYDNYELSAEEQKAIDEYDRLNWGEYRIKEIFDIYSYKKRFDANKVTITENTGHPYIVRTGNNNGCKGYIEEDEQFLNDGNTISFGQDTATMYYQEKPYFTGDKIKILHSKIEGFEKSNALFFLTAMNKAFSSYSWGASRFDVESLQKETINLPIKDHKIDIPTMNLLISAIQKLVIKDVVLYSDQKIAATKAVVAHKSDE